MSATTNFISQVKKFIGSSHVGTAQETEAKNAFSEAVLDVSDQYILFKVTGHATTPVFTTIKNKSDYTIGSVTRNGAGDYTATLGTAGNAALFADIAKTHFSSCGSANPFVVGAAVVAGGIQIKTTDLAATPAATDAGVVFVKLTIAK